MIVSISTLRCFCKLLFPINHDLVNCYRICSTCHKHPSVISSCITYHRVCNQINTKDATSGTDTSHLSGAPEFTPGFQWGSCCSIFRFLCSVFVDRFFSVSFGHCIYLSFDLRILIIPLVSSNSFYVICYKLPILTWHFYIYAVRTNICSMVTVPITIYTFGLFNN